MNRSHLWKVLRNFAKKSDFIVGLHFDYYCLRKLWEIKRRYLAPNGYWNPFPSDSSGEAIPWYTYPAITFLKNVIQAEWKVFEYGCGYSTVFWNRNCAKTVSVEHDEQWFNRLRETHQDFEIYLVKEGTSLRQQEATGLIALFEAHHFHLPLSPIRDHNIEHGMLNREFANYAATLTKFPRGFFDVIIVDGMARSMCLYLAAEYVSEDGMIILDNSDRWQYNDLQNYLIQAKKFKRIEFQGLGPLNTYGWTTSVFFKNADFLLKARTRREQGAGGLGW